MNQMRLRAVSVGPLRAFDAVARHLAFGAAAVELNLTQPAVSRQVRALEAEVGMPLFTRSTRHVELTAAGAQLHRAVAPMLARLDGAVRQLRTGSARRSVSVSTFASFASLWLIPRLQAFQRAYPDIDIRLSAGDALTDPDDPDTDLVLRYVHPNSAPVGAECLFGEVLTPVIGAATAQAMADGRAPPLRQPADLAQHTLLEEDDSRPSAEYLSWRHWLSLHGVPTLEPRRWIYLNFTHQQIQGALAGQGVALARVALVHDLIARGELVEPFGAAGRITSPFAYWMALWPQARLTPQLRQFVDWVRVEAQGSRAALGVAAAPP